MALVAIAFVAFVRLGFAWYSEDRPTSPPYSAPRTPWGDPDLQGAFTNTGERGLPMERPDSPGWFQRLSNVVGGVGRAPAAPKVPQQNEWEPTFEETTSHSRGWLVVDPPDGKIPPPTHDAWMRATARGDVWRQLGHAAPWLSMGLFGRCITRGVPESMVPTLYGNVYDITQGPGVVVIRYEMVNEARVIPLDGHPHVSPAIRSYMGDARGRFEGDTLIVETTNFTSETPFRGSSAKLRLVERFTPTAAGLEWSVTLDDPATWSQPWTFAMSLNKTTQGPLEFACHEGNYAMRNMLAIRASGQAVKKREASIVDN